MINEMRFFDEATSTGVSKTMINTKGGILTIQATGTANAFEFTVSGCVNLESNLFEPIKGINISDFSLAETVKENGIYEYDISGIRQLRVNISSIDGGTLTVMGISKEG